jgi:trans-aconitate methyltransferase
MGVKFGEIDASQILENEYRIGVLEGFVEWILTNNSAFVKNLTDEEMNEIRQRVVKRLQQKYPKSGIELRRE